MILAALSKATFWGAILIFALITFYCWFVLEPKMILAGTGSFGLMLFIAWLRLSL